MIILKNTFRRMLKKKSSWLFIIILPIVLMSVLVQAGSSSNTYYLGISDQDKTDFTKTFIKNLGEKYEIVPLKEGEVRDAVINSEVDYALVINKGTTGDLISGVNKEIEAYSIKESNISAPLRIYVDSYMSAARGIGIEANGDEKTFYKGMDYYLDGKFEMLTSTVSADAAKSENIKRSMGFLVLSMVILLTFATTGTLKDKMNGLYLRIQCGPITKANYQIQSFISYVLIAIFQLFLVFMVMVNVLKMDIGGIFLPLFLVMVLFAVCCVALGTFVTSISNNVTQASALLNLINIPMCMLGGAMWPSEIMPEMLQTISVIFPTTWVIQAADKIVGGASLAGVGVEIAILAGFTMVFLILSILDIKMPKARKRSAKVSKTLEA
ncbi:ABC transporter permease [Rossellomorea marisflavi]|uniref:ABC transporter permease n=1 Tax=Rossellomorea marisflavi TaxID=189381 RepID=UPI00345ACA0E